METNKDALFYSILLFWLICGLCIALFTTFNIWFYNIIMCWLFIILTIIKINNHKFNNWLKTPLRRYKLSNEEKLMWENIKVNADKGYNEWLEQTKGDDLCGPWLKDYTKDEEKLIEKIHAYFYGEDWYCVMPLSNSQVNYLMYYEIKDKVI